MFNYLKLYTPNPTTENIISQLLFLILPIFFLQKKIYVKGEKEM